MYHRGTSVQPRSDQNAAVLRKVRPAFLFALLFVFFLRMRVVLKLRPLGMHPPRLCRLAIFLIHTSVPPPPSAGSGHEYLCCHAFNVQAFRLRRSNAHILRLRFELCKAHRTSPPQASHHSRLSVPRPRGGGNALPGHASRSGRAKPC